MSTAEVPTLTCPRESAGQPTVLDVNRFLQTYYIKKEGQNPEGN